MWTLVSTQSTAATTTATRTTTTTTTTMTKMTTAKSRLNWTTHNNNVSSSLYACLLSMLLMQLFVVSDAFSAIGCSKTASMIVKKDYSMRTKPSSSSSSTLSFCLFAEPRGQTQMPILDLLQTNDDNVSTDTADSENDNDNDVKTKPIPATPLPSAHLPLSLVDPFLFSFQVKRPFYKLLFQEAYETFTYDYPDTPGRMYGHLVYKPNDDTLVGAIGCACEICVLGPTATLRQGIAGSNTAITDAAASTTTSNSDTELDKDDVVIDKDSISILSRGLFRFVVKEVVKTIPYPVAIIEELQDDDPLTMPENREGGTTAVTDDENEEDDDDDDDDDDDYLEDDYASLTNVELVQRTLFTVQAYVKDQVEQMEKQKQVSPLEQAILEEAAKKDGGIAINLDKEAQFAAIEEMAAVWEVFQSSLIDICPMPKERYYAIAMMAAAIVKVDNDIRKQLYTTTNGLERLRIVLKAISEIVGMAQAQKMANSITEKTDDAARDLKVGQPQLPPWAKNIRKGTRVEYFWSEQDGWYKGTIIDEPVMIIDELIMTVEFDDGEIHKLPFSADEKVRWRPA